MTRRPLLLITGASRGIGAAIARQAASRGYDLVLTARTEDTRLAMVAAAAREAGAAVHTIALTLNDRDSIVRLRALMAGRTLAGLINNPAHVGERSALVDQAEEDLIEILAANVQGTILLTRAMIPFLGQGGTILMMSSQSAQFGGNGLSVYAASKAALNGLTVSLARELAPAGIRVVAVSPGPVLTEPLLALGQDRLTEMQATLPLGRFCTVDEVANTVLWLVSPEASYISGAILPVHGAR